MDSCRWSLSWDEGTVDGQLQVVNALEGKDSRWTTAGGRVAG